MREVQELMMMRGFTRSGLPEGWLAKAEPKGFRFITNTAVQLIGKIKGEGDEEERRRRNNKDAQVF